MILPPDWVELYFDNQGSDGRLLREILQADDRLKRDGFLDFLLVESDRILTLTIYEVGVFIVDCRPGPDGKPDTRPWPVESETAARTIALFREREGRTSTPSEDIPEDGSYDSISLSSFASIPPANGVHRPLAQEPSAGTSDAFNDNESATHYEMPQPNDVDSDVVPRTGDGGSWGHGVALREWISLVAPRSSNRWPEDQGGALREWILLHPEIRIACSNPGCEASFGESSVSQIGRDARCPKCDGFLLPRSVPDAPPGNMRPPSKISYSDLPDQTVHPEESSFATNHGLASLAESVPSRIGDCRIIKQIGRGGMGVVYLARQVHLDRLVAIKVLPGVMFNYPHAIERLVREARIGAQLRHPNICQILDARQEGGEFYFVMEYVEGETLSRVIQEEGRLSITKACDFSIQLFDALKYLARKGVVHRDIKPANLMVLPDGNLKLLDLGLAKVTSELGSIDVVTRSGEMMGTPGYLAPEQVTGAKHVSVSADLYAAGCTLFEMVTGEKPFTDRRLYQLLSRILNENPPDPRTFRNDLPDALADLIIRLLSKTPEARPSPDEVLYVVGRFASKQSNGSNEAAAEPLTSADPLTALGSRIHTMTRPVEDSQSTGTVDIPSFLGRINDAARNWKEADGEDLLDMLRGSDGEPRLGEYRLLERLGPPSAISSFRAEMPHSGVSCVIRVFPPAFGQFAPERLRELLREQGDLMRISTRSSHLSGLTFLGRAQLSRGALRTVYYTVENFYEGQCLDDLIKAKESLGIREARRALLQAVSALTALHDERIIHGNMHPGKILLDLERRDLCIVDLSRARRIDPAEASESDDPQTLGGLNQAGCLYQDSYRRRQYLAPEILCDQRPHSLASEQYALSVAFIEILTGNFIRTDENDLKLVNVVRAELEDRLDDIAEDAPRFAQVLRKMVKPNAESRYDDLRDVREALLSPARRTRPGPSGRRSDPSPGRYSNSERGPSDSYSGSRASQGQGPYDIFLSYRREGGAYAARAISEALERRGFRVFLDVDRLKSGRFDTKLLLQIQNSPNFVVVMSEGALDRCQDRDDWLRREIAHAIQCRSNILPIMMPGFDMPKAVRLPHNLRRLPTFNAIRYEHEHHDGVLEQLLQFIKSRGD